MADSKWNQNNEGGPTTNAGRESSFSEELIEDKMFLLASIVESSDDAIITKTSNGIITSWNRALRGSMDFPPRRSWQTDLHFNSTRPRR